MKFGITLALAHSSLWPELTRRADELGYESAWLPEHLVLPVQMAPPLLDQAVRTALV